MDHIGMGEESFSFEPSPRYPPRRIPQCHVASPSLFLHRPSTATKAHHQMLAVASPCAHSRHPLTSRTSLRTPYEPAQKADAPRHGTLESLRYHTLNLPVSLTWPFSYQSVFVANCTCGTRPWTNQRSWSLYSTNDPYLGVLRGT